MVTEQEYEDFILNIGEKSAEEIRNMLIRLCDDERKISYQRRLLHGRIDLLKAELVKKVRDDYKSGKTPSIDIEELVEVLANPLRLVDASDILPE